MESIVPSAGDLPMRSSSTIDAVEEALQLCKAEIGEGQPNATFDLGGCSEDQEWLITKADEVTRTLRADLRQPATRRYNSEERDEPWFSIRIISLKDDGEPQERMIEIRAHDDIHCLTAHDDRDFFQHIKAIQARAMSLLSSHVGSNTTAVAFLLLMKRLLHFGVPDLCALMGVLVPRPDTPVVESALITPLITGDWHSATVPYTARASLSPASTKVLRFPGPLPPFETKYYWMERHKTHGKRPKSASNVAIWGDWRRSSDGGVQPNHWSCLMAFSDHGATNTYSNQLCSLLSAEGTQTRQEMANHWISSCYYVYLLGLNDARLRVVQAAEAIDNLRYENAADPSIGASLVCLMFMNHLEHHKRLVEFIRVRLDKTPDAWEVVQKPDWTQAIDEMCQSAIQDIEKVHEEASKVRSLVIEQYGISGSRSLGFLSILAAFFIPITAVSGFFGMNTMEINGSSWPTKYFGIVAGPLTIISVLLPLFALYILDYLLRFLSSSFVLPLIRNILLLIALGFSIWDAITPIGEDATGQGILSIIFTIGFPYSIGGIYLGVGFLKYRRQVRDYGVRHMSGLLRQHLREPWNWQFGKYFVLMMMYWPASSLSAWLPVAALVLYFVDAALNWYWGYKRSKTND
ncbi:hypothetical protein NM208_g6162 [Fusarium decemcellulare]|uniref:Uncharacterized protein n=1 Tax=Fusarium decemcellulare TaxID=57161 RepID=A0ACC1SE31_9HYPO|nr:hypothetical protein NM208_g6162 [Fusarium decemcellulare]